MHDLRRADGTPFVPTCHHDVFVTDEGIVPFCDLCDGPQFAEGDNWNSETGNHYSCEELQHDVECVSCAYEEDNNA